MNTSVYDTQVKAIMSKHAVTLNVDDSIHKALQLMGENRVSALPVLDDREHCVGILCASDLVDMTRDVDQDLTQLEGLDSESQSNLIRRLAHSLENETVESYMSETLTSVRTDTTIANAAKKMLREGVHHLPVLDDEDRLTGIVSTMDILAEFVDNAPT